MPVQSSLKQPAVSPVVKASAATQGHVAENINRTTNVGKLTGLPVHELNVTQTGHDVIVNNVIRAARFGLAAALPPSAKQWPPTAQDFSRAWHRDNLAYKHDTGLVNPSSQYLNVPAKDKDYYLCFVTLCTFEACPFGAGCRYRHAKLEIEEIWPIALQGPKGISWLEKYARVWAHPSKP
ncbi:hypothetical protein Ptr902_01526 [Pyrenophora tritici-repentis]|uniref:Uncharacterized protein n=1 Tax=Pyrenophora tritici-repentis TaxID=45151 RepID=A0A2W1E1L1_9PLEO|nr:hypothetical protein PtrM4_014370 [Pyrenophora tritici-repentis]KAI1570989.1 hypothetical protein PtrEW4_005048 [Pyrenophora tritici-repentis]KAI1602896.1 hypothetical protein PtrCC142_004948 [Pyrenophora tritici-repentis]KAI2487393.1 hypothetical protein Ptr902_01526 [Pyrenophora tritici-repentis]PWO25424.1 hypothetical protein PtrARCrB10_06056 [Pyrenophora tritici-repentis]